MTMHYRKGGVRVTPESAFGTEPSSAPLLRKVTYERTRADLARAPVLYPPMWCYDFSADLIVQAKSLERAGGAVDVEFLDRCVTQIVNLGFYWKYGQR